MRMQRTWLGLLVASGVVLAACSTDDGSPGSSGPGSSSGTNASSSSSATTGGSGGGAVGAGGGDTTCPGSSGTTGGSNVVSGAGGSGGKGGGTGAAGTNVTTPDAGSVAPKPSAGCNKAAPETPAQFVKHSLMSSGVSRDFYTYLPAGYDPKKAYPTIFTFHPCGGSGNIGSNVPIQNESKGQAIIIAPQSKGNCYENQIRNSPDVTFFDDTLKYAEDNYCVDQSRVFAIGHSAGSWMSIILGCNRANVLRAHAQVSGGMPIFIRPGADCNGNMAALLIHDTGDPTNTINGGYAARDRLLRVDRCDPTTKPWPSASQCVEYQGCKPGFPVVWCETKGKGHGRQDDLAPAAIWKFFSQL